jgi:hypothetical protein
MNDSKFYQNAVSYSLSETPFSALFDAPDGSSSNPNWVQIVSEFVNNGDEPIFNHISDDACVNAWKFLFPQIGCMPNMLSVKIALASGVCTKEDILSIFIQGKGWIDQASFRGSLGEFLGIHNTQLLPLSMVIARQESTKKLFEIFSDPDSVIKYLENR